MSASERLAFLDTGSMKPAEPILKRRNDTKSVSVFGDPKRNSNEALDIKRRGYDFVDSINQETMVFTDISFTDQWLF